jgi:hypothetical protein
VLVILGGSFTLNSLRWMEGLDFVATVSLRISHECRGYGRKFYFSAMSHLSPLLPQSE